MKDDKEFLEALESRKVPILVLDQKWHRLFALSGKTSEIKQLEEKLNQLLEQRSSPEHPEESAEQPPSS